MRKWYLAIISDLTGMRKYSLSSNCSSPTRADFFFHFQADNFSLSCTFLLWFQTAFGMDHSQLHFHSMPTFYCFWAFSLLLLLSGVVCVIHICVRSADVLICFRSSTGSTCVMQRPNVLTSDSLNQTSLSSPFHLLLLLALIVTPPIFRFHYGYLYRNKDPHFTFCCGSINNAFGCSGDFSSPTSAAATLLF